MPPASLADCVKAREWADVYRDRGFSPWPSRTDNKAPMCRYANYWTAFPLKNPFKIYHTSNVQVMTGRAWRLLVIDLDGPAAMAWWDRHRGVKPRTWIVESGSGTGRHIWYRLPPDYPRPLPKAVLWQGEGKHSAVERLCDTSLVMAPPSIHPVTKKRYFFKDRRSSPYMLGLPADIPDWILRLPPIEAPAPSPVVVPIGKRAPRIVVERTGYYRAEEVLASIPDKIALAQSWGVRFTGRVSDRGWAVCHAIDRDDSNPSAAIQAESGVYVDKGSGRKLSFFKVAVARNVYASKEDAVAHLGAMFCARQLEVAS